MARPYALVVAFIAAAVYSVPLGWYKLNVIILPLKAEPFSSMKSAVALIFVFIPDHELVLPLSAPGFVNPGPVEPPQQAAGPGGAADPRGETLRGMPDRRRGRGDSGLADR